MIFEQNKKNVLNHAPSRGSSNQYGLCVFKPNQQTPPLLYDIDIGILFKNKYLGS